METVTFKVLWVDDQIEKMIDNLEGDFATPQEHSGIFYKLEVIGVSCWEKAVVELKKDKKHDIIALILDAHCKIREHDDPNLNYFIVNVLHKIPNYKRPYFIFSGQAEDTLLGKIDYEQEYDHPDYDWKISHNLSYYKKPQDLEDLRYNIIEYGRNLPEWKIKSDLYHDLFSCIRELELPEVVAENMVALLKPIHFGDMGNLEYLDKGDLIRKTMEHIFRSMYKNGMLPRVYMHITSKNGRDSVNFSKSIDLIKNKFAPDNIKNTLSWIKDVVPKFHHTKSQDQRDEDIVPFLKEINSTFFLKSLVFWLCDFIMWYHYHMANNSKEQNKKKWEGEIDNPDGFEGLLFWNEKLSNWNIKYDKKSYRLDSGEPGYKKNDAYHDNQKCLFFIKNEEYAYGIETKE